ncbi:hypothetical protein [Thermomonas fusca]|uniref:Uncharacterized protein n=1 Tax=Thermomonas fusca TaxID=215690 RepID=A0A5R9PES1_9GAMM|nr:hypothetical protein [Thermomonas fusca]TLX21557.1 hypothetical protein E5S66_08475 [Thermomonas fusca]
MARTRFLAKSFGDNRDGTRAGLRSFLENLQPKTTGVIVVPTLSNVKDTILVDVLGEDLSRQLIKNREITLQDGATIQLCSIATLKNHKYADSYLALWAPASTIEAVEQLTSWSTATVVTWLASDADKWLTDHAVQIIFDDGKG